MIYHWITTCGVLIHTGPIFLSSTCLFWNLCSTIRIGFQSISCFNLSFKKVQAIFFTHARAPTNVMSVGYWRTLQSVSRHMRGCYVALKNIWCLRVSWCNIELLSWKTSVWYIVSSSRKIHLCNVYGFQLKWQDCDYHLLALTALNNWIVIYHLHSFSMVCLPT